MKLPSKLVKKIYQYLLDNYPKCKQLPAKKNIKTVEDIFRLKLSHLKIGTSYGYFDRRLCEPKQYKKPSGQNYFRISSFEISKNKKQLQKVIERLYKVRDTYKTIYFDIEDNGGGDMIPSNIILYCLGGGIQSWMKDCKTLDKDNNHKCVWKNEWNPWTPWIKEENTSVYDQFLQLQLSIPDYDKYKTKFNGNIVVYSNHNTTSTSWYFVTYLAYSFSSTIKRYKTNNMKIGKVSGNLKIHGCTDTQSGDGNPVSKKFGTLMVKVPTQETCSRSVLTKDLLRYWH